MKPEELERIVRSPESENLEIKAVVPEPLALAQLVCGFLNAKGGSVVLGVDAKGRIVGVPNASASAARLQTALPAMISPPARWTVERVGVQGREVLVLNVPEGNDRPYVVRGAIHIRRGTHTLAASRDDISTLIAKRTQASLRWERQGAVGVDRGDLDEGLIEETARMARQSERWSGTGKDTDEFLSAFGLAAEGKVTNAALVCFGRNPTRWLPQARVRLLVLPSGKTGDRFEVDRVLEGPVLRIAEEIPPILATHAGGVSSEFVGERWQRTDRPRYPMSALREGVMNALVHRDYGSSSSITISVLGDTLVITNPGGLPDGMKPADLKHEHPSVPRNPDIAHVCFLRRLIEKVGRGTQSIVEDCRSLGLREPRWVSTPLQTTLTFFAGLRTRTLSPRQEQILAVVRKRRQLTASALIKLVRGVTDRTLRSDLQALVDAAFIVRSGKARSTIYSAAPGRRQP